MPLVGDELMPIDVMPIIGVERAGGAKTTAIAAVAAAARLIA